jgi:hypothetical protein
MVCCSPGQIQGAYSVTDILNAICASKDTLPFKTTTKNGELGTVLTNGLIGLDGEKDR